MGDHGGKLGTMLLSPPGLMLFRDATSYPQQMPAAPTQCSALVPMPRVRVVPTTLVRAGQSLQYHAIRAGGFIELCFNHLLSSYCLPQLTVLHERVLV